MFLFLDLVYQLNNKKKTDTKGIPNILQIERVQINVRKKCDFSSAFFELNLFQYSSYRYRPRTEKRRDSSNSLPSYVEKRQAIAPSSIIETRHSNVSQAAPIASNNVGYNLSHIGAGPAIAAAASQAIAATQQVTIS